MESQSALLHLSLLTSLQAPELLLHGIHSPASDVYAFAVMANEVLTGVLPFSDCTKDNPECHTVLEMGYGRQELAAAVAAEGLRPIVPRWAPQAFAALLERCWHGEPGKRPPMRDVVQQASEGGGGAQLRAVVLCNGLC